MKFWRHSLFAAFSFLAIASSVLYTACEKDACTQLSCRNGGSCADGFCRCPSGFDGAECEIKLSSKFLGKYYGTTVCGMNPNMTDTLTVFQKAEPNLVCVVRNKRIGDTLCGNVTGNLISIPDVNSGNYKKYANVQLEVHTDQVTHVMTSKKITVFEQEVTDAGNNVSNTCEFVGTNP